MLRLFFVASSACSSEDCYTLTATLGDFDKSYPDEMILDQMIVAAPGVPLGITKKGCQILENRLLHDKLELGVAGMAISLFL